MRNHRKILVVDGQVGFTGGTNIREGHCLKMAPDFPVQCLHFILRGPVVRQLSRVFAIDWAFATGEELSGDTWFPKIDRVGEVWARGIEHGPHEQFERLTDLIAAALASAQQRVRIVTPYFLPHSSLIQSLNAAALRNVEVEIYIPAHNNITQTNGKASSIDIGQRDFACRLCFAVNNLVQFHRKIRTVTLHVKFKIQTQTPRIPVGGTDQGPNIVNDHHLGMVKRVGCSEYSTPFFQILPQLSGASPFVCVMLL